MILLFEDYGTNYWIKNKIVDCGSKENNQQLNIDLELPDDEIINEHNLLLLEEESINNTKKLNIKYKQYKTTNNNESRHKKIYIGRNSEIINGNSRTKNSGDKFGGTVNQYKDSDFRINHIQKTPKHICLYKYVNTNYHKRKMH